MKMRTKIYLNLFYYHPLLTHMENKHATTKIQNMNITQNIVSKMILDLELPRNNH